MHDDPIVAEVRRTRHDIESECHNAPGAYLAHLRRIQARFQDRVVRGKPMPLPSGRR